MATKTTRADLLKEITRLQEEVQSQKKAIAHLQKCSLVNTEKYSTEISLLNGALEKERSYSHYLYNEPAIRLMIRVLRKICRPLADWLERRHDR